MIDAARAHITLTDDIEAHLDAALALDARATRFEDAFLFDDPEDAETFRRFLCAHKLAAFSAPHGLLALAHDRAVGLVAGMTRRDVLDHRLALAVALHRENPLPHASGLLDRLRLVDAAHPDVRDGDFYWSRISVEPSFAGRRAARALAGVMAARARALGCARMVGEVAAANADSRRFFEKLGYRAFAGGSAVDPRRGLRLDYVHMDGPVPPPPAPGDAA